MSYVRPRYRVGNQTGLPATRRYPRTIARGCSSQPCVGRFLYRRGARLSVPGVFSVRVLGGSPVRVRTTWLDRTPPALTVVSAAVRARVGAAPEAALSLRGAARGAGMLAVEVDQGGSVTRVPADFVPGLVGRGRGEVRVPWVPGTPASVRLVDAAGNASAWVPVDLSRVAPAARVDFTPALGTDFVVATRLSGQRVVTISGATDPAFAGLSVILDVVGESESQELTIGPDGTFTTTWSPAARGEYRLIVKVPVERQPDGFNLRLRDLRRVRSLVMAELPQDVRALFADPNYAHVATVAPDGAPHSVPVWVGLEGDRIVFFTQEGTRKARNLAADPRVAFSLIDGANPYHMASVRGRVVATLEGDAALEVIDRLAHRYTGRPFPMRSGIVFVVEPEKVFTMDLPFEHTPPA